MLKRLNLNRNHAKLFLLAVITITAMIGYKLHFDAKFSDGIDGKDG